VIGAVVPDPSSSFFSDTIRSMETALRRGGHHLLVASSGEDPAAEDAVIRLITPKIDGLVLSPAGEVGPAVADLAERRAVVIMDRGVDAPQLPSVVLDNRASAERATRVLLDSGHRRIALVNGPLAIRQCADRRRGAYQAVLQAGLDPTAVLTEVTVPAMNTRCGADAADELRAIVPSGSAVPTAAFCTNDLLALGLLRRLSQLGAHVPGDLAIVGYDDIDFAADSAVPLTSVRQPKYRLGQTAAQLLLEEADAPAEHEHRRFVFTPELITRASSAGSAGSAGLGGLGPPDPPTRAAPA
jgi:LacI family transcriptional regulator